MLIVIGIVLYILACAWETKCEESDCSEYY